MFLFEELSMKDVHSQEGGRFVQCGHFADKGEGGWALHKMRMMSALFGVKSLKFLKFMVCQHEQGGEGVEPVRKF